MVPEPSSTLAEVKKTILFLGNKDGRARSREPSRDLHAARDRRTGALLQLLDAHLEILDTPDGNTVSDQHDDKEDPKHSPEILQTSIILLVVFHVAPRLYEHGFCRPAF